jgi:hypothetical protein
MNTAPDMIPRLVNTPSTMSTDAVAGPSKARSPISVTPSTRAALTSFPVSWPAFTRARKTISRRAPGSSRPIRHESAFPAMRGARLPPAKASPGESDSVTMTLSSAVSAVRFSITAMKLRTSPTSATGSRIDCSIETIGMLDLTSTSSTRSRDSPKKIEAASTPNESSRPANFLRPSLVDCRRRPTTVDPPLGIAPADARKSDSRGRGEPFESTNSTCHSAGMAEESARETRTLSAKLPRLAISCQSVYDSRLPSTFTTTRSSGLPVTASGFPRGPIASALTRPTSTSTSFDSRW